MSRPVCVITGTTHGIGRTTAEAMAMAGYELVMACRDVTAAEQVRREIAQAASNNDIHVVRCDLGSLSAVRDCAREVRQRFGPLTVLINNAGTMTTRFRTSPDGVEMTFAVNYLGPWLLTRLLLDRVTARIVNVASTSHFRGALDPTVLGRETAERFSGMQAYARSKLGNVMATLSLAERMVGAAVTVNCLHPGVVATNIVADTNALLRIGMRLVAPLFLDTDRGAKTTLHLALSPDLRNVTGAYFDEHQRRQLPAPAALDRAARDALWRWSSRFCGLPEELADVE